MLKRALALAAAAACVGQAATIPITADNSIVLYPGEEHLNAGRKTRIRIKGNQHLVALRFDCRPLRGRVVKSAVLVCCPAAKRIDGVTLSTIAAPWSEYASCGLRSGLPGVDGWAWPHSRFPAVTGGNSFTLVCQARSVMKDGRYHWRVAPDLIHANAVGAAYGLTVHEWSTDYSRNPTIFSREQSGEAPYLLVEFGGRAAAPQPPRNLRLVHQGDLDTLRLELTAPASGFAYEVRVNGRQLPRWNTPFVAPGRVQRIPIRDLPLRPGERVRISVVTLNRTGRRSAPARLEAALPTPRPLTLPAIPNPPSTGRAPAIPVIPIQDKYDAAGRPVGDLPADYLRRNPVFDGECIRLTAARGEVVGFQALLKGRGRVRVQCRLAGLRVDLYRAAYVKAGAREIPDPLLPCGEVELSPRRAAPVIADVFVPFDFQPRRVRGEFTVSDGRRVPIELTVRRFALPRRAAFLCEMNSYGLPERMSAFYRLQRIAYDHRAHVNILYYNHRTAAAGARKCVLDKVLDFSPNAPGRRMNEKRFNAIAPGAVTTWWNDFIAAFGPYLSGRCFADGWRGPVPAPGFYLMFHESWPLNMRPFFNGDPDAYEAFKAHPEYAQTFVNLVKDFIRVARREGWTDAGFQIYFNNKGKLSDPRRAPWVLDEPSSYWDYRALRFYAELVKRARGRHCPIHLDFRIDISRPQFDRGQLWGAADLWVVNTKAMRRYRRIVWDRMERTGERIWLYAAANPVARSNRETHAWALEAYRLGACGVVPWQTIDRTGRALRRADTLGLFIFADRRGRVIYHSMRLKAFRRAEQDVEYLNLLRRRLKLTRAQTAAFIRHYLRLRGRMIQRYAGDAGESQYGALSPFAFYRLREAAARLLEAGT